MQFAYPVFLLGLLGIALPIIIHLIQLRRPQRLLFTNTAFIREVELVTIRHRRVQHLLILLARVLAITGLVLAFCQPFIPSLNKNAKVNGGSEVFVDNSNSMQLQNVAQRSLFESATMAAKKLATSSSSSSDRIRLISGKGWGSSTNKAGYQTALDELRISGRATGLMLSQVVENNLNKSLYVFSDFQKTSFNSRELDGLGLRKQVVLAPMLSKPTGNIYTDSVWLDDAFARVRTNIGLHIRLHNGGDLVTTGCPVKVYLGNRQVAAFRATVEPGQSVTSVVQVQVNEEGLALARVVTEDVPVTFDNTYYFTLQPAGVIRVLEIGAVPVAQELYGNEPLFAYSFSKPQNVDYGVLRRANLVLLQQVGAVDAGLRDGLKAVVQRGGSVVVVPSEIASGQASYQQLFRELGLGNVQWEARNAVPVLQDVAMPNVSEPFFRDVFGAQQRAVTMPRAAPVLRWSRTQTDLLKFKDGESFLADFKSGAGHAYMFSAPFASAYSDFTAHALFVPVMYRMAMLSYRNEQLPAYRLTQGTVVLKLPTGAGATGSASALADETNYRLVKDSLTLIPAQRVVEQELRLDMPAEMGEPGFYQVQKQGKVLTTLAFNQNKRESELAAYSADELRELIGPDRPNITVLEDSEDGVGLANFEAAQTGQPLWRYFLAFALACLLAEALLVRFGNRGVKADKVTLAG